VPLAIVSPDLSCTLLEATRKKADFVRAAAGAIGLSNVNVVWGRAEETALDPRHRERYEVVVARAVAKLDRLAAWLLPFAREGGIAVACKSRHADAEIEAAQTAIAEAGGRVESVIELAIPETDVIRKLVILRKTRSPAGPGPGAGVGASRPGPRRGR
jgi:16S rRNA (guanine527-N7)-methyltransferase